MRHFKTYISTVKNPEWLDYPILSQKVREYMKNAVLKISDGEIIESGDISGDFSSALVFLNSCPALSLEILDYLTSQSSAVLMSKGEALALYGPLTDVVEAVRHEDFTAFEAIETPPGDAAYVYDTESAFKAQELIREKINQRHLKNGVMIVSPQTTHIAPGVIIGRGTVVLPGCLIYGQSSIGENCRIGPNCLLENAEISDNASINSSQIMDSFVGRNTTVGPFSWIRPGCRIGSNVRIGDFVELKKAEIGDGTKVSHLTYIGDARFGQRINVGCGTVVVNYDGKNKYLTTVGDDSFIGCNVNLVSPVNIGSDTFIAAGSTITDDVENGAFAIARCRQTVKPQWEKKRGESGKL